MKKSLWRKLILLVFLFLLCFIVTAAPSVVLAENNDKKGEESSADSLIFVTTEIPPFGSLKNGEPVGRIAPERASGQVPPHLHLSLAWMSDGIHSTGFSWDSLAHNKDVVWLNPLDFLMEKGIA